MQLFSMKSDMQQKAEKTTGATDNGYVQVWATAPEMAPAKSLRNALGFLSPSGVNAWRIDSYTMKFRPTYSD